MPAAVMELACAKVNLALRILARRADGYHELDSIVAFADIADRVTIVVSDTASFVINGRFASGLDAHANSVQDADSRLRAKLEKSGIALPQFDITLEKNLPVASGIGGGSADAAAYLRAAQQFLARPLPAKELGALALSLGADVPVCLAQQSCRMQGIGEVLLPFDLRVPRHIVLINPLVGLPTKHVFAALGLVPGQRLHDDMLPDDPALWHNDLATAAMLLVPDIADVMAEFQAAGAFSMTGMSGSGATCFGLSDDADTARVAAQRIAINHPQWWVKAGQLLGQASP
jgi:4-diphosphocytidyl-2-C-methyl-D-erythritol kinase